MCPRRRGQRGVPLTIQVSRRRSTFTAQSCRARAPIVPIATLFRQALRSGIGNYVIPPDPTSPQYPTRLLTQHADAPAETSAPSDVKQGKFVIRAGAFRIVTTVVLRHTDRSTEVPSIKQPEDADSKDAAPTTNAPLAPPPKPTQNGGDNDYFSGQHGQAHLNKEPNPFENAFGNPAETPGKTQLPGVTSLTSPASLLPANTPGWPGSLRSGPLSPAMLAGPTSNNDYFSSDHHFSGSFPTPNESSLRTGLTPGGGGSMFPQPSPNSQALYNSLQSGGATPGTLDFHRTAMHARAHSQANNFNMQGPATSQPQQISAMRVALAY